MSPIFRSPAGAVYSAVRMDGAFCICWWSARRGEWRPTVMDPFPTSADAERELRKIARECEWTEKRDKILIG